MSSTPADVTLAGRMVARDLIERVPGPGRAVRHRITEHGEEIRAAGQKAVGKVFATSFAGFSAKQLRDPGHLLDLALGPGNE